jgi:hypothetical protein
MGTRRLELEDPVMGGICVLDVSDAKVPVDVGYTV